jgi:hypothetical protein
VLYHQESLVVNHPENQVVYPVVYHQGNLVANQVLYRQVNLVVNHQENQVLFLAVNLAESLQ